MLGRRVRRLRAAQAIDGYDVVETVAAQPWVEFGKVGMVGISYPGIMQLFTAGTQPPHLAAISPLSVIDDIYRATLYPGGILNTGFASTWAAERQADAEPGGQPWAQKRIDEGDETCIANQALRGQNHELADDIEANEFYTPGSAPTRSRRTSSSTGSTYPCSSRARGRTSRPAGTSPTC